MFSILVILLRRCVEETVIFFTSISLFSLNPYRGTVFSPTRPLPPQSPLTLWYRDATSTVPWSSRQLAPALGELSLLGTK